jgi:hypothetical protein
MDVNHKILFRILRYSAQSDIPCHVSRGHKFSKCELKQEVAGYAVCILDPDWKITLQDSYFGRDAMEMLLDLIYTHLHSIVSKVKETFIPLRVEGK